MDRKQHQQAHREEGEEKPPRQQQQHADHFEKENRPKVTGSSEETPGELRHSRSLSGECVRPIRCLQHSPSMPKFEGSRKGYNRLIGDSLHTDSRQDVKDVVTTSLQLMDDLLILVQADSDLRSDHPK